MDQQVRAELEPTERLDIPCFTMMYERQLEGGYLVSVWCTEEQFRAVRRQVLEWQDPGGVQ